MARNRKLKNKRSDRTALRKSKITALENAGTDPKLLENLYSRTVIGKGAYDFRKAASGKYAARKRRNTVARAVDIGGRALGAVQQFNSGDYLGGLMSGLKILGKGDYTLSKNTVVQDMTASQVPTMHSGKESIRFRHREFLGDLYSPSVATNFQITTYNINPGSTGTFPFLSPIAQQFQEYKFHGLAYEYKSTSAVAIGTANTIGMGTVSMAAQYRATAPTFTSKIQMMNEMWSVDGRPSDCFMLPIECNPAEAPLDTLYVRNTSLTTLDDTKFFDLAKFSIAMQGIPVTNQVIGELWVTYDVELFKPVATELLASGSLLFEATTAGAVSATPFLGTAAATDNFPFIIGSSSPVFNSTTGYLAPVASTLYTTIVNTAAPASIAVGPSSIVFPVGLVGTFGLTFTLTGTSASLLQVPGVDCFGTAVPCVGPYGTQNNWQVVRSYTNPGLTTTSWVFILYFRIVNSSAQTVITLNTLNAYPSANTGLLTYYQINNSLV